MLASKVLASLSAADALLLTLMLVRVYEGAKQFPRDLKGFIDVKIPQQDTPQVL